MIDTDQLYRIQMAVLNREEFEATGLKKTAPLYETYLQLQKEYAEAPEAQWLKLSPTPLGVSGMHLSSLHKKVLESTTWRCKCPKS